ncbi:FKBP-type peptidyl-prolyl cis-trans isomerase [Marinicella rhabdoformis]|uniref:FKBP-type peptidyl-prolyl cis-trans isomerase n=1 Tax=Marinicella rhabdoformis TaxID=2580566 RepID=UPI0015D00388|nr:FKBP-type peptidyl-prolyl cis-trans isomerase [Marinicella rhabdoformis]
MKKLLTLALVGTAMIAGAQAPKQELPKSADITFDKNAASYAVGYRMGLQLAGRKGSDFSIDVDQALKGMKDAASEKEPAVSKELMTTEFTKYQQKLQLFQAEQYQSLAAENQKRSDDFLAQNRKKTGIKELASGVQYRVIEAGSGKNASVNDTVSLHYRGSLIGSENFDNMREFDSTYTRGEPLDMDMTKVGLKGWREIIPMMKAGDKWQVFLPPEMAYGVQGVPNGPIGPNEVLVFDVHLLAVK